jgi:polysaccharide export outer membrane protein
MKILHLSLMALILALALALPLAHAFEDSDDYVIGPKDVIEISVFGEPDLSKTIEVGPQGTIRFPLLREVKLLNLTVRQAEKKMETLLGERFLVDPQVSIQVKQYMSQRVYVLGTIKNPGYYPLKGRTTLLEIISAAGGITDRGGSTILLIRGAKVDKDQIESLIKGSSANTALPEDPTQNEISGRIVIDGNRLLNEGDTSLNYALAAGDIVYIPVVKQVFVMGEVRRPGGVGYKPGLTVLKAITLAGGLTELGKKKVLIKRNINGEEVKLKVNLSSIIKDSSKDIPLLPDDVIVVPRRVF